MKQHCQHLMIKFFGVIKNRIFNYYEHNNKLFLIPAIISSLFIQQWLIIKPYEEMKAEQIIKSFIEANDLILTSTEEYLDFYREIFWGKFPELVTLD